MSNFVGTSPFLNSIMGCHGNHAFSHSPDRLILELYFAFRGVLMNNLHSRKNALGVQGKLNWPGLYCSLMCIEPECLLS